MRELCLVALVNIASALHARATDHEVWATNRPPVPAAGPDSLPLQCPPAPVTLKVP